MTTMRRLQNAIDAGESLKIVYNGGSQPGAMRDVTPISIKGEKCYAHCFASNAIKLFAIEKITILSEENSLTGTIWKPKETTRSHYEHYESIAEFLENLKDTLIGLGWNIKSDDISLSLHRRFKNGKLMKGADITLDYEEFTYDSVIDFDGECHEENKRKKRRPWCVRGKSIDTRCYGSLGKASALFMQLAVSLAPLKS